MLGYVTFFVILHTSLQDCPEEVSQKGIQVKWRQTTTAYNVESDPLCYKDDDLVKRNCTDDNWIPQITDLEPCLKVLNTFNSNSCPPGYQTFENSNDYCFYIGTNSSWDYPCLTSGGATVITELNKIEITELINSLVSFNRSRYYWLPAHRPKILTSVVWTTPGPNRGIQLEANDYLPYQNTLWKNCLALDVERRILKTEACAHMYPSICLNINNVQPPVICPKGYQTIQFKLNNGTCYGIEKSDTGMSFDKFRQTKCKTPMIEKQFDSNRLIFMKLAKENVLQNDEWCWFKRSTENYYQEVLNNDSYIADELEGIINSVGTIALKNSSSNLYCMACEKAYIYEETEFMIEYNEIDNKIYLTVYFPSGLWRYGIDDKGIQCFSDAKGFVKVVNINSLPFLSIRNENDDGVPYVEKVVYIIDLVAQRSAQYWCEGHSLNFSLITTNKLVVNPTGKEMHVFAMTITVYNFNFDRHNATDIDHIISILSDKFKAEKILWMDIYNYTVKYITILIHIHITITSDYEDEALNIMQTYNELLEKATLYLPVFHCSLVNLSSSLYCLPTISNDTIELDWELTPISHISAPKQFCLQSNGLPVKRQCLGSYHNGAIWGAVEGTCDSIYEPTETTEFLYNVVKGQLPSNYTNYFLIDGLEIVLSDVKDIIPADIYYLSISLQHILYEANMNDTCVDIGDIDNIVWIMDRVMELDCDYLRLSQTLNSTNVILNSVSEITELIAQQIITDKDMDEDNAIPIEETYQLAIMPQYAAQISYPMLTNVTGLAIIKPSNSDKFTDMIFRPLYGNSTLDEVLAIDNLEIAAWIPWRLLKSLKPSSNDSMDPEIQKNYIHMIINVHQNDVIFQELIESDHMTNSRIIGVSIPGYLSNLEFPLPIVFKGLHKPMPSRSMCGFWDFNIQESTLISGLWKTQGCFLVMSRRNITVCECYHLTHFSQLITIHSGANKSHDLNEKQHHKALNTITLVGCFLSIIGVVGIWITAIVFSTWRKKAGTKILLQLSTAISLPLIFIVIFNLDNTIFVYQNDVYFIADNMRPLCIALGSLLHYSILASFMWMLITAVLQFIRYVRVLGVSRPSRFMFKFSLIAWGIPIIPVATVLTLDMDNYVPELSHVKMICYPYGIVFILSVLLPICIILAINIILFVLVLHSISHGSNDKMKSTDIDLVGAQMRLSIFLFFLLGLTWIFGIFSFSTNLIWSYLFCLTSTLQGFVLFIYFIVCDPITRNMWITFVKPPFTSGSSRNSITSLS